MNIIVWITAVLAIGAFYGSTSYMHANDELSTIIRLAIQAMWFMALMPEQTVIKKYVLPATATAVTSYLVGAIALSFAHRLGMVFSRDTNFEELMAGFVVLILSCDYMFDFFQHINKIATDDYMARE